MIKQTNKFFKIKDLVNRNFFKTFIIAEIGINHEGDFRICKQLIHEASKAGADAVKLQTINPNESYHKNTASYKAFKNKDFTLKQLILLKKFALKKNLILFSTPGDISSLNKISKARFKLVKISSGLCTNTPLIEAVAKKKIPIILSTGMSFFKEIQIALKYAQKYKNICVGILKCTSLYPSNDNEINLKSMNTIKKKFKLPVGLSDHTLDDLSVCASVANGANIIEKHITLNKNKKGADHKISLTPKEFQEMVSKIRRIENILGKSEIFPVKRELKNKSNTQRFIFAAKDIKKGNKLSLNNISFKRSNLSKRNALKASSYDNFKNFKIKKNIKKDTLIKNTYF